MTKQVFTLTSPDIKEGHFMAKDHEFDGFGCSGTNVSPTLNWANAPAGTKSFAVTVFDPDAPTCSGFWHWLVTDIPAAATGLARGAGKGSLPPGCRSFTNDYGMKDFVAPAHQRAMVCTVINLPCGPCRKIRYRPPMAPALR